MAIGDFESDCVGAGVLEGVDWFWLGGGAAVGEVPEVAGDCAGGTRWVKSGCEWRGAGFEDAGEAGGKRSFADGDDDGFAVSCTVGGDGSDGSVKSADAGVFVADFGGTEVFAAIVAEVPEVAGDLAAAITASASIEVDGERNCAFDFVGGEVGGEALVADFDGDDGGAFIAVAIGDEEGNIISSGVLEGIIQIFAELVGDFVTIEVPSVLVDIVVGVEAVFATELDAKWRGSLEDSAIRLEGGNGLENGFWRGSEGADDDLAFDSANDTGFVGKSKGDLVGSWCGEGF